MEVERFNSPGKLKFFHNIFQNWHLVLEEYITKSDYKDCQWWYNERATLSSLSAAIWKSNGIAIEEYSTKKGRGNKEYSGRCDMYFSIGIKKFVCESKQVWCAIGRKKKLVSKISKSRLKWHTQM